MSAQKKNLQDLKNVGKATLEDLHLLAIHSVDDLACQDATDLFYRLEAKTQMRQDPCVWDVFAAIIHEAKTGEATVWWKWTPMRKALQKSGKLTCFSKNNC
ncbi:MAG: Mitomycin resistance protein mcrB [Simkaniaceae bacterium]|nr:Mitomycin resistance protein mcrB [Simkaniaceae bacterium]